MPSHTRTLWCCIWPYLLLLILCLCPQWQIRWLLELCSSSTTHSARSRGSSGILIQAFTSPLCHHHTPWDNRDLALRMYHARALHDMSMSQTARGNGKTPRKPRGGSGGSGSGNNSSISTSSGPGIRSRRPPLDLVRLRRPEDPSSSSSFIPSTPPKEYQGGNPPLDNRLARTLIIDEVMIRSKLKEMEVSGDRVSFDAFLSQLDFVFMRGRG